MKSLPRFARLFFPSLLALASAAQAEPVPHDWVPVETRGAVADTHPSARAKLDFWDRQWERLAGQARVPLGIKTRAGEVFATQVEVQRYFHESDAGLFIVDRARLDLKLDGGVDLLDLGDDGRVRLELGTSWQGESVVVRPLKDDRAAHQLDRLIDPSDLKLVLPIESGRIAAMRVGEVWQLPVSLRASFAVEAGYGVGGASVSLSLSHARQGGASVTLRRMAEDQLRLRLRLNQARLTGAGLALGFALQGSQAGAALRERLVAALGQQMGQKLIARAIENYVQARLRFFFERSDREGALVEFLLDPRDAAQMQALERLLTGDVDVLDTLALMSAKAARALAGREVTAERVDQLTDRFARALGQDASFAGLSQTREQTLGLDLSIPVLGQLGSSYGKRYDRITVLGPGGGQYRIYAADHRGRTGFYSLPWVGALLQFDTQERIMTAGYVDARGEGWGAPLAVYVQQERFERYGRWAVAGMFERADRIMRYAAPLPQAPELAALAVAGEGTDSVVYRRGRSALTVVFSERALTAIRSAGALAVHRAYVNTINPNNDYRPELEWVLAHGRLDRKGWLDYDERALQLAFHLQSEDLGVIRDKLADAAALAKDLGRVGLSKGGAPRSSGGQAEDWRDLIGGYSRAGFSYGDVLDVLVQLADPADIAAEFVIRVEPGAGQDAVDLRYVLHPELMDAPRLQAANEALNRFAAPPVHGD